MPAALLEKSDTPPWVLIDLSYLAYRAMYAIKGLEHNDIPTGVIFGFLEQLRTICTDPLIMSNRVAIFADSRQSYRRRAYPTYKEKRLQEQDPEKIKLLKILYKQIRILRTEILPAAGFHVYRQIGLEADDLIAQAVKQINLLYAPTRQGVMVTADGDLYQCISDSVHWYDPARRLYYDQASFWRAKGIGADAWDMVKSYAGCSSDNVKGIPGVGESTAIKYILFLLPTTYKIHERIASKEGKAIARRNMRLVSLPHEKTRPVELLEPEYNATAFFELCQKYGLDSAMEGSRYDKWLAFFDGSMKPPIKSRKRGEKRDKM